MKTILLMAIILIGLTTPKMMAQQNADLDARVRDFTSLLLEPNEAKFKEITSSKLTYGHSNSLIEDQSEFIHALVSGKSDYVKIDVSEQKTEIIGKTAIVRQKMELDVASNGNANHLNLKVLLVWAREKGKWILVARQAVRIPQQ
ncbi:MAG: nuclear transport factor 2 family protein [Saprospiraceae bacterium]|nr:nuclear transport factor 2 family protein [Saprospiraceae bacterium]